MGLLRIHREIADCSDSTRLCAELPESLAAAVRLGELHESCYRRVPSSVRVADGPTGWVCLATVSVSVVVSY